MAREDRPSFAISGAAPMIRNAASTIARDWKLVSRSSSGSFRGVSSSSVSVSKPLGYPSPLNAVV
jgi:hypothetical protein